MSANLAGSIVTSAYGTMTDETIYIVDDDATVRDGLETLLMSADFNVVTFASANDYLRSPPPPGAACLLLDVRLPDLDGLELQTLLKDRAGAVPIIFMTGFGTIPMSVRAIKAGAVEFLTKPVAEEQLFAAVKAALETSRASLREQHGLIQLRARLEQLTPREREVMQYVIGGLKNKQLAAALGTSEITAKVHKRRVMEKMGARTLVQLVHMAETLAIKALSYR